MMGAMQDTRDVTEEIELTEVQNYCMSFISVSILDIQKKSAANHGRSFASSLPHVLTLIFSSLAASVPVHFALFSLVFSFSPSCSPSSHCHVFSSSFFLSPLRFVSLVSCFSSSRHRPPCQKRKQDELSHDWLRTALFKSK